jgi:hypothetical protein
MTRFAGPEGIGLPQDARVHQLSGSLPALMDERGALLALYAVAPHDVLRTRSLFRNHDASPALPKRSNQKMPATSMT